MNAKLISLETQSGRETTQTQNSQGGKSGTVVGRMTPLPPLTPMHRHCSPTFHRRHPELVLQRYAPSPDDGVVVTVVLFSRTVEQSSGAFRAKL